MSDEEKKAIDLLKNIDKKKCLMLECPVVENNIERQLKIIELNRIIRKQSKEIEELKEENKEIREWKYVIDNPIDLKKLCELDLIKIFGKSYISEDEIKAKIEECREILYGFEKELELKANKDKFIHKESMNCLLGQISILQSLLEKE